MGELDNEPLDRWTRLRAYRALLVGVVMVGLIGVSVAGVAIAEGRRDDSLAGERHITTPGARGLTTTAPATATTAAPTTTTTTTTTEPPPEAATPAPAPSQAPARSAPTPPPEPDPGPSPPPPPPQPGPPGLAGAVVSAMNADRAANGLGPLGWNGGLAGYAQSWANWMAANGSLTHQSLSPMFGLGLNTLGENILVGPSGMSADAMESAWMSSPGHRANILNGAFTVAGVGMAISADGRIWIAVDFGG